jgi:hypothetical protein
MLLPVTARAQTDVIASIAPASADAGTQVMVMITGGPDCAFGDTSVVSFHPATGITHGLVVVLAFNRIQTMLDIPAGTPAGLQDVEVTDVYGGTCASPALFEVTGSSASLSNVVPSSGAAGQSLDVEITGVGTHFTAASQVSFSGGGIQVTSVDALSGTRLRASLDISPSAATGNREVTVTTGAEVATGSGLFRVEAVPFTLTPDTGRQGEVLAQVTVVGGGIDFSGSTSASLGQGVSVGAVQVQAADRIVLTDVQIALDALVGLRDLTVATGAGARTLADAFGVLQGPATRLVSASPPRADRGHPGMPFSLVGENTHFDAGTLDVGLVGPGSYAYNLAAADATHLSGLLSLAADTVEGPRTWIASVNTGRCVWQAPPNVPCESVQLAGAFEVSAPGTILSLSPAMVDAGSEVDVSITAQDGSFVAGATSLVLDPADGIEVLSVSVSGPNDLVARLRVAANASGASRDVTTVSGPDVALGPGALDVVNPELLAVSPSLVRVGQQGIRLRIACRDVPLDANAQVDISGDGLRLGPVSWQTGFPDELRLTLDVTAEASLGLRHVTVNSHGVTVTKEGGLMVAQAAEGGCDCASSDGPGGAMASALLVGLLLLGLQRPRRSASRR